MPQQPKQLLRTQPNMVDSNGSYTDNKEKPHALTDKTIASNSAQPNIPKKAPTQTPKKHKIHTFCYTVGI